MSGIGSLGTAPRMGSILRANAAPCPIGSRLLLLAAAACMLAALLFAFTGLPRPALAFENDYPPSPAIELEDWQNRDKEDPNSWIAIGWKDAATCYTTLKGYTYSYELSSDKKTVKVYKIDKCIYKDFFEDLKRGDGPTWLFTNGEQILITSNPYKNGVNRMVIELYDIKTKKKVKLYERKGLFLRSAYPYADKVIFDMYIPDSDKTYPGLYQLTLKKGAKVKKISSTMHTTGHFCGRYGLVTKGKSIKAYTLDLVTKKAAKKFDPYMHPQLLDWPIRDK